MLHAATNWAIGNSASPRLMEIGEVDVSSGQARIRVLVPRPILFTSELPGFARTLLQFVPSLQFTLCHNDHGLRFEDELRATEMGHVIEHVVLALLTEFDVYAKGTTEWNWFEEPEGTFTITLMGCQFELGVVERTVARALSILEQLLSPFLNPGAWPSRTASRVAVRRVGPPSARRDGEGVA